MKTIQASHLELKLYAITNPAWRKDGWKDQYQCAELALRGIQLNGYPFFKTRKQELAFKNKENGLKVEVVKVLPLPQPHK